MALSISNTQYYLSLFLNASFVLLLCLIFITPSTDFIAHNLKRPTDDVQPSQSLNYNDSCRGLHKFHSDVAARCAYTRAGNGCESSGYIPYLQFFYCNCRSAAVGYIIFVLWLMLLFYLLGNTAANYFCPSLEGMSRILKLSPAVAGVTLLSLGNGAPDLFSSIISFMGDVETGQVGLNSILGGAFFVSSVVIGIISIYVDSNQISVDRSTFRRDILFLIFSLTCLLIIIFLEKINLWGAICFLCLYFVYVTLVSSSHVCAGQGGDGVCTEEPLEFFASKTFKGNEAKGWNGSEVPLLVPVGDEKLVYLENGTGQVCEQKANLSCLNCKSSTCCFLSKCLSLLQLPLYLPRRLTIPVISEAQWSKPFAVSSATISPFLLAFLSSSYFPKSSHLLVYTIGCTVGSIFGILAFLTTNSAIPPRTWLFPWIAGGFVMSITWTYILAQELVSLLVSLGLISGISSSVLGLTVLAWGNSFGDLVANVSMAATGGAEGTQVAISGSYAGPLFNMLVSLGISLVISSWSVYPANYVLPRDPHIFETMAFLAGGWLFALVILSKKNMRLDRYLGGGLLSIYLCFLFLRIARASGLIQFDRPLPPLNIS